MTAHSPGQVQPWRQELGEKYGLPVKPKAKSSLSFAVSTERPLCLADNCSRPAKAKGLCVMHYTRDRRAKGLKKEYRPTPKTPLERFPQRYVVTRSGCWQWTGPLSDEGYAKLKIDGSSRAAHRWRWEQEFGSFPQISGLELDHTCHSKDSQCQGGAFCLHRSCVNPWHLDPVTVYENWDRGRSQRRRTQCASGHSLDLPEQCVSCRNIHKKWQMIDRRRALLEAELAPSFKS